MASEYVVTCWLRSPSTRGHIGSIAPAETRMAGLEMGRKWMRENAEPTGLFRFSEDYEVGYKVEKRP